MTAIAASQLFIQLLKNLRTVGTAALRHKRKSAFGLRGFNVNCSA
jgi:hypothetical protein